MSDDARREFMLAALRVASLEARKYENEINAIGVALKGKMITCEDAMQWLKDINALGLMPRIPEEKVQINTNKR